MDLLSRATSGIYCLNLCSPKMYEPERKLTSYQIILGHDLKVWGRE